MFSFANMQSTLSCLVAEIVIQAKYCTYYYITPKVQYWTFNYMYFKLKNSLYSVFVVRLYRLGS